MNLEGMHLSLFFTRGVSLQTWVQIGSLERELALYLRLQKQKGIRISFVTHGNAKDLEYAKDLQGIEILCNKWNLSPSQYERLLPFLYPQRFYQANLIKTNQTNGADIALRVARVWRKPMIARCGYMWSQFAEKDGNLTELALARRIEQDAFSRSTKTVVTTHEMKHFIVDTYGVSPERIHIVPNYVLTEVFSPQEEKSVTKRICFIGRLTDQKNLFSLIEACVDLDVDLHFIGEGYLRASLREKADKLGVRLTLHGNLLHDQLPDMIRQSALFTLVSSHEGHPKSLLEAMACGVAVLGADSPGIRDHIIHGETGWLVGTDPESIRAGIQHLLGNPTLREKLGANARRFVLENYSLDKILEMEYTLYEEIIKR